VKTLCFLAVFSFLISSLLTPIVRNVCRRLNLVDRPNDSRKFHTTPVPRVGGISIALSYAGTFALLLLCMSQFGGPIATDQLSLVWRVLPAACIVFATGLLDDLVGLKPWQKLAGQFVAAGWAYWAGVRIFAVVDHEAHWWSLPLTILWLLCCSNAFNLIDGLDGLAAGIGMLATLTTVLAALIVHNFHLAVATLPLAGCLLAFLCYNFSPASIFLGDCGSLLIGFLLGCYGVIWSQKSATTLGMAAPVMAMTIPVLDVTLSIIRRLLRHQPIFTGDRGHIHHRLLALGLKPGNVALVLYGVCGLGAVCSLLQSLANAKFGGAAVVVFCAMVWIGVQRLKYVEFGVATQMLMGGEFRRILQAKIRLEVLQDVISTRPNIEDFWLVLRDTCKDLGFSHVSLHLGGLEFEDTFAEQDNPEDWSVRVALSPEDSIVVRHAVNAPLQAMVAVPFIETMHRQFARLHALSAFGQTNGAVPELVRSETAATV
jgi:UDP-GlcNAc:undecaprenyl-phosphate/decaprenyl-phosphate GlcNAc-1-phosphate transferase